MKQNTVRRRVEVMVAESGLTRKPVYPVGEVALIIGVSVSTVRQLCDRWGVDNPDYGIESYRIGGRNERRIPFHGIVDWLSRSIQ